MRNLSLPHLLVAFLLIFSIALPLAPAYAVNPPEEVLDNPELEARARDISTGLRCLVCQNQSIDDSDAPLAKDLRVLVRERLVAGDTDAEAKDFLVSRYGEFVLLKPSFSSKNYILWGGFGPLVLILGLLGMFRLYGKNQKVADAAKQSGAETLNEDEQLRLKKILSDESEA